MTMCLFFVYRTGTILSRRNLLFGPTRYDAAVLLIISTDAIPDVVRLNNSLLAKWPNLACFQVVLCGRGTILMSEPRRGIRAVFFYNPVFKSTRQYRAGTVM